jgi:hypothetical protein
MSYLGNDVTQQLTQPAIDYFSGNGVATTFTLTRPVQSAFGVSVVINNVQQNPSSAYSIVGNQLILTGAPSPGVNNIYVIYNGIISQTATPPAGSVNTAQLGSINNVNSINSSFTISVNGNTVVTVSSSTSSTIFTSSILPTTDGVYNLGSTSSRWLNIYTGDLHLSNQSHETGNSIDGTKGNWTIQEGETELYIINNNNGKRYKIKLEEI